MKLARNGQRRPRPADGAPSRFGGTLIYLARSQRGFGDYSSVRFILRRAMRSERRAMYAGGALETWLPAVHFGGPWFAPGVYAAQISFWVCAGIWNISPIVPSGGHPQTNSSGTGFRSGFWMSARTR